MHRKGERCNAVFNAFKRHSGNGIGSGIGVSCNTVSVTADIYVRAVGVNQGIGIIRSAVQLPGCGETVQ